MAPHDRRKWCHRGLGAPLAPLLAITGPLSAHFVLGGLYSPIGAVLGALVLVGVPELLRLAPDVRILGYGVVLLLVVRFRPQGLWVRAA